MLVEPATVQLVCFVKPDMAVTLSVINPVITNVLNKLFSFLDKLKPLSTRHGHAHESAYPKQQILQMSRKIMLSVSSSIILIWFL